MIDRLTRRSVEVPCTVDIADTPEDLYAHVVLQGFDVGPGDEVLVHDAPTRVDYGARLSCNRRATVTQAGWFARAWTRLTSRFELTLLYEVSFTPTGPALSVPGERHERPSQSQ